MTHHSRRTRIFLVVFLVLPAALLFFGVDWKPGPEPIQKPSLRQMPESSAHPASRTPAAPTHSCSDPNCTSNHSPSPRAADSATVAAKAFPLLMPKALEQKSARVGDVVVLSIGTQAFSIELTTAAYMATGFLFEGTIGEDGIFMLGEHEGIRQGALVPSATKVQIAYTLEGTTDYAEWIEKPISEVYCAANPANLGHDEVIPVEYYLPEERGINHPIPIHNSRPEATAVILLDFDDHKLDSEGTPLPGNKPFNRLITTEQMTYIWEKVSEYLVYFDINVTTDESVYLAAPLAQNLRVVFRNSSANSNSLYAAMALLTDGIHTQVRFDLNHPYHMPTMADIISTTIHEIGHGLNLKHDGGGGDGGYYLGDGEGKSHWGPIMGSNYSRRFIQWSIGEYAGSNNKEDDLQLMQDCGQFGYLPDDHSDLADASATDISTTIGPEWDGIIGEKKDLNGDGTYEDDIDVDVDVFAYTANSSGLLEIDVCTKVMTALNLHVELVNSSGELQDSTALANPIDSPDSKVRCLVDPGTYYLKVAPAGRTLPNGLRLHTTYATMGSFKIDYAFTDGAYLPYTINTDIGSNGSIELNGTETAFSGDNRTVKLIPDTGYQIQTLTIDGQPIVLTADARNMGYTHSFTNIQEDHVIQATFEAANDLYPLPTEDDADWLFIGTVNEVSNKGAYGNQSLKLKPLTSSTYKDGEISHTASFQAGNVSFCYSQLSHDGVFEFSVDGQVVLQVEGYQDWTRFTYAITEGYHTLSWKFIKNGWAFEERNEGAWVDEIELPAAGPPIAFGQTLGVLINQPKDILLTGYDVERDYLTYAIVDAPLHGELIGSGPDLTYVPDTDYTGSDSFTYRVSDDATGSAPVTVSLTVVDVAADLELHWSFDSPDGTAVLAVDASGNNRDGTVLGSATRTAGLFGQAMSFDGVDDAVTKDITQISFPQYSVTFWANAASLGQEASTGLFSNNGDSTNSNDFQVDIADSYYDYYRFVSGNISERFPAFEANKWVHIAVVCDGTHTTLYQDGIQTDQVGASGNDFGEFTLGMNRGHSIFYAGMLDELRVYSRALTPVKVEALASRPAADRYNLTVTNGQGSGERTLGSSTQIIANPPAAQKEFKQWNGDHQYLADRYAPNTTVTMPNQDITVRATYADLYTLSVTNGTGSGDYLSGSTVAVVADPAPLNHVFDTWTGDIDALEDPTAASTNLTMPSQAASLTATYRELETLENGLLVHWSFDGSGSSSSVEDVSPNNHTGTFYGDAVRAQGPFGQAIQLDGDGDYIRHEFTKTTYSTYSVSLWAKAASLGQSPWVGLFNNDTNGTDFQVDVSQSGTNFYRYVSGSKKINIGQYNTSDWIHLAVICNGSDVKLYFNGNYVNTVTNKLGQDFGGFTLGTARSRDASSCFHGWLDELRVYDRVLTTEELTILAQLPAVSGHELTVWGGSGTGNYAAEAIVSISADAPAPGYQFVNWTSSAGGSFADSYAATTNFTMPASDTSITATYRSVIPQAASFALQPNGDGSITLGFEIEAGRSYRLEYSPNLIDWYYWTSAIPVSGTNTSIELTDDGEHTDSHPSQAAKRFYRVVDITNQAGGE